MSIYHFTIPSPPYPKPRGKVSKYGHLYHNTKEYVNWKTSIKEAIIQAGELRIPKGFTHACFVFNWRTKRGHKPDGENLQGGLQDALVEHGFLPDDDIDIIPKWYGVAYRNPVESIEMYFCSNFQEFLHVAKLIER